MAADKSWLVYIIQASDGRLYTGITNDMDARWKKHQEGKGAKFFRGRKPSRICYTEQQDSRSSASQREASIKRMTRAAKLQLIETQAHG